jgi:putative transposase
LWIKRPTRRSRVGAGGSSGPATTGRSAGEGVREHITLRFVRRSLPHWIVAEASFFVTIRLAGTLPRAVVEALREEREAAGDDEQARLDLARRQFVRIESILDSDVRERNDLAVPEVARRCMNNLQWLRERGWHIYAATFLSNHAHVLMRNVKGNSAMLLEDLDNYKGFTGREANKLLRRRGRFWARDQFDHWIRKGKIFDGVIRYIARNPVKAGLVGKWKDWPWTIVDEEMRGLADTPALS